MSAELESEVTLVCRTAELPCISSVSLAVPQNQCFLLLGQSGLSEQTSFCCCFNILPLLKIKGRADSSVFDSYRNGNHFHFNVATFFFFFFNWCPCLFCCKPDRELDFLVLALGRATHRDILEVDGSDIVVGAALPGVVEAEGESARVPPVQSRELAERAVLDIDGPVIELDPSDGKIPKMHSEQTERERDLVTTR